MKLKFVAFYTDLSVYEFQVWLSENQTLTDAWALASERALSERPFMEGLTTLRLVAADICGGK